METSGLSVGSWEVFVPFRPAAELLFKYDTGTRKSSNNRTVCYVVENYLF